MKIQIQFKDPDSPYDAIQDAVETDVKAMVAAGTIDADEAESLAESRLEKEFGKCGKWLKYREYVTIEIDTDAGTAVVLPA